MAIHPTKATSEYPRPTYPVEMSGEVSFDIKPQAKNQLIRRMNFSIIVPNDLTNEPPKYEHDMEDMTCGYYSGIRSSAARLGVGIWWGHGSWYIYVLGGSTREYLVELTKPIFVSAASIVTTSFWSENADPESSKRWYFSVEVSRNTKGEGNKTYEFHCDIPQPMTQWSEISVWHRISMRSMHFCIGENGSCAQSPANGELIIDNISLFDFDNNIIEPIWKENINTTTQSSAWMTPIPLNTCNLKIASSPTKITATWDPRSGGG